MTLRQSLLLSIFATLVSAQTPFATNTRIPVGTGPVGLTIADFNGDGRKDIAVANQTSRTISVLLGNGAGAFTDAPGSPFPVDPGSNTGPTGIAAGDFNGDGKPDIVYIDSRVYTIGSTSSFGLAFSIRLGNGDGTFAPSTGVAGAAFSLDRIRALDMNGDGKLDIVGDYRSPSNSSLALYGRVYLGDGAGHLTFGGGGSTEAVDLNGDGKPDYVNVDYTASQYFLPPLAVVTSTSSGYITRSFAGPPGFGINQTTQLRIADFDRDGALDVLVLHPGLIQAWRGDGSGAFVSDFQHALGSGAFSLAVADFDGDGILDWAARTTSTIEMGYVRQPARTVSPVRQSIPIGIGPGDVEVADFNNDGKPDLVAVDTAGNDLSLLLSGTVSGATQTITFQTINPVLANSGPFPINATASSGLPVTVASSSPLVCTLASSIVTIVGKGTCVLTANQAGNSSYQAATPASRSFAVNGVPQTITITPIGSKPLGSAPFTPQVTTSSGLPFSLGTNGLSSICAANNIVVTVLSPGRCDLNVYQDGDTIYEFARTSISFDVTGSLGDLLPQTLTFDPISDKIVSATPFRVDVIASSGLPTTLSASSPSSTLTCTYSSLGPDSWNVTAIAPGTCTLTVTQNGGGIYVPVSITRTVNITLANKQAVNLSIPPPGDISLASTYVQIKVNGSNALFVFTSNTPATCTPGPNNSVHPVAVGVCSITVTSPETAYSLPGGPVTVSFNIVDGPTQAQTITFPVIPNYALGTAPFAISAISSSYGTVTFMSNTSAVCTISDSSNTVTLLQQGTCSITASQAGGTVYLPAPPVTRTFSVTAGSASQAQSITFNLIGKTRLSDGPFTVTAVASSGLPVTVTSTTPATCTVAGFTVTPLATNPCTLTATQAGNNVYQAALPVTQTVDITPNLFNQFVSIGPFADITVSAGSFTVSPIASSGLPATLTTSSLGYCSITGYTIYLLAPGICTITATAPGDNTWTSGSSTRTLPIRDPIALQAQTLTFAQLPDRVLGTGPFFLTATTSSLLTPSFITTTPDICSVTSGGVLTPKKVGQCAVTAFHNGRLITYTGETLYSAAPPITRTFTITAGGSSTAQPQTITFLALSDRTLAQSPGSLIATATSGLPVSFTSETPSVCTVTLSSFALLSSGTCIITASQAGDSAWAPALSVSRSFTVTAPAQAQTLTFNLPSSVTRSTNSIPLSATITPGPGTIAFTSSTPEICGASPTSLSLNQSGTCSVTATASPATAGAFQPISVTRLVSITGSSQTITFAELPNRSVNSGSFIPTATASSGLQVNFLATGTCAISGTTVSLVGIGTCTITARQEGSASWDPAPQVVRSFQITSSALQSQTITFNQPPDRLLSAGAFAAVATASSGLSVTLTSSNAAICTVQGLNVQPIALGMCVITASQAGNSAFAPAASVTRSFTLLAGSGSSPIITAVVNAASYTSGSIAPSSYVAIFGNNFGTSPRITIRDAAGTVSAPQPVYSGDTQINLIWPASALGSATVTIESAGLSGTFAVSVANAVPALFSANSSGKGLAAANVIIVNNDKSVSTRLVADGPIPVLAGTEIYLVLYGTGIRGSSANGVTAKVAGRAVEVVYAGAQGAYPGLDQINLRIPLSVGGLGSVVIELTVDGSTSNEVTATFQ